MCYPNQAILPSLAQRGFCNPWRSLRAQVSPVCPQISFVIPRTPCSGSAASSIETVVFVFVKLFAGMASSNVWAWPLILPPFTSTFQLNSFHLLQRLYDCIIFLYICQPRILAQELFSEYQPLLVKDNTLRTIATVIKPLSESAFSKSYHMIRNTILFMINDTVKSTVINTEYSSCKREKSQLTSSVQNIDIWA